MAKLITNDQTTLQNDTSAVANINANFTAVENAMENTLSRDGTSPNMMAADLDMNSKRILNLPHPATAAEPLRLGDTDIIVIDASVAAAAASATAAASSATNSATSATSSATSATAAASSASAASTSATSSATSATASSGSATASAASAVTAAAVISNSLFENYSTRTLSAAAFSRARKINAFDIIQAQVFS